VNEVDAVLNLTGFGLEHWPWTKRQKQKFIDSRVIPGRALVSAIQNASRRPKVFLQISGINHYGLRGESVADESTPAANDFLAQLTVQWEAATQPVEGSVRRSLCGRLWCLQKVDSPSWRCPYGFSSAESLALANRRLRGSTLGPGWGSPLSDWERGCTWSIQFDFAGTYFECSLYAHGLESIAPSILVPSPGVAAQNSLGRNERSLN
jgi:hypothetical protein